ncbi:hypothetical protein J7K44_01640 [bacterium]|nr:hypothetical protein [bacterium]
MEKSLNIQFFSFSNKKGSSVIFILLVLVVVLVGFTGVLASRVWDPLWNPFRPSPEEVIKKMSLEMEKVKTSKEKMEISLIGKNEEIFELKLNTEGEIDETQPEKPKSKSKFNFVASLTKKEEPMGIKFALNGETKLKDEVLYLRFTTLPTIPLFPMVGINLSQIEDQWIKIDQDSIIEIMKGIKKEEWTPEMEEMYRKQAEKERIFQKEFQEKIKKILKEEKLFVVKKEFPDEKINKKKVYHYLVALNKEEFLREVLETMKVLEEGMLKEYGTSFTFKEKEFKEKLGEFLDKIGEIKGEIWIGKKDYLLYKIKGEKNIDLSKFGEKGSVIVSLNLEYSGFNEPVRVETPSDYKDISEVLASLNKLISFFEPYQASTLRARDARITADMTQVRTLAVLIYSNEDSYKNLCYNLTLNENAPDYGDTLGTIEKDIQNQQGGVLKLSCYSSKESYCISADLVSPNKGKFCIDSSGTAREISKNSTCLGDGTLKNPYRCPEEKESLKEMNPLARKSYPFQSSILESFLRLLER